MTLYSRQERHSVVDPNISTIKYIHICMGPTCDIAHLKPLVGIHEVLDWGELNPEEWTHMPETDQIVDVDPIDIAISVPRRSSRKWASRDGVCTRGKKPRPLA